MEDGRKKLTGGSRLVENRTSMRRYAPGWSGKMRVLERFHRMNGGIHVQVPNAYETREDLVSHSALLRTSIQPPYRYDE